MVQLRSTPDTQADRAIVMTQFLSQKILNLPVNHLQKSVDFFMKLGFSFNPQFTDCHPVEYDMKHQANSKITRQDTITQQDRELTITRLFDAPRDLVFRVWTQPEHLTLWLGPKDFTTIACQMNVQLGGMYRACIRSPQGKYHWMQGTYHEILEPERLVFTFAWEDEHGNPQHETLITLTFAEQDRKTLMTFHQALFEAAETRDSHRSGWSECFDRMGVYIATVLP